MTKIATEWGFDAAWQFQGVITLACALLALFARARPAPRARLAADVELG